MIVEKTKQDKIKNIIINIANNTKGIRQEHIRRAIEKYIYDERDIEVIERELWAYSAQIEENVRIREEQRMASVNKNNQAAVKQNDELTDTPIKTNYNSTRIVDNYIEGSSQSTYESNVTLQQVTEDDTIDELSTMFSDVNQTTIKDNNHTYQAQHEKGKSLVKTMEPVSNNRGQAAFLNLCFIFSTMSILGLIISTIIVYAYKIFN